jgi:uncharacterized protein YkwD
MDHDQGSRLLIVFSGVFLVVVLPLPALRADPPAKPDPLVTALIEAHNRERATEKKAPLKLNARLEAAARAHARDMADHEMMSHDGSDGSTPSQRIDREEYHGQGTGENVARGQKSVDEVMRTWMNSPGHRENILGDYSEIGVARALAGDGTPYWCTDFGLEWPSLDPSRASAGVVKAVNQERSKRKRPPLKVNTILSRAAQKYVGDLAARDSLERQKDDPDPLRQIAESSPRFRHLGVLEASYAPSPEEIVKTWLGSANQSEPLLGDQYNEIGVGYATAAKGTPYWVVFLARAVN